MIILTWSSWLLWFEFHVSPVFMYWKYIPWSHMLKVFERWYVTGSIGLWPHGLIHLWINGVIKGLDLIWNQVLSSEFLLSCLVMTWNVLDSLDSPISKKFSPDASPCSSTFQPLKLKIKLTFFINSPVCDIPLKQQKID